MAPKKQYKKRAPMKKMVKRRSSVPRDGMNLLVNSYAEIKKTTTQADGVMAYSLCIDPRNAKLVLGADTTAEDGAAAPAAIANNANITNAKFTTWAANFNQYRINSATLTINVPGEGCGLENTMCISNDKGVEAVIPSIAAAKQASHKEFNLHSARRSAKYKYTCRGNERDWYNTAGNQLLADEAKIFIKVFQKLPGYGAGGTAKVCEHQVNLLLNVSFKDSKN